MTIARSKDFSQLSFSEVVQYYRELRQVLYDDLSATYPQFKYKPITQSDAMQADSWRTLESKPARKAWSWIDAYHIYNIKSCFKRFDICAKRGVDVFGLSYGEPTVSKAKLKIDIVEATPIEEHKQDKKIFEIISTAAQFYAILLGADEVRIMNPLSEELADYYCSYGYEYVTPKKKRLGVYCSMKLGG